MNRCITIIACTLMWWTGVVAQPTLDRYEWWVDGDYAGRTTVTQGTTWDAMLDLSSLPVGLHKLNLRAGQHWTDADGTHERWSVTIMHFFYVPPHVAAGENPIDRYEWWIDKNADNVTSGKMGAGGVVDLNLDLSALPAGLHTLDYRVVDLSGQHSATMTHYFIVPPKVVAGANQLDHYEWWIDKDRSAATSGKMGAGGVVNLTLDLASLAEGLHTLDYCVVDLAGQASPAMTHYFVVPRKTATGDNQLDRYEWWLDGDRSTMQSGKMGDGGVLDLALDMSAVTTGLHLLSYRVLDKSGAASATLVKYFVVLNPNDYLGDRLLTKYAYWFNRGDRIEVEVTPPAARIDLKKQVIPVENVVPNQIGEDYVFDVGNQLLQVTDDVVVGLQVFDNRGVGSAADTVVIHDVIVPVDPHFLAIKPTDDPYEMSSPTLGVAQGFYYDGYERDSLQWVVSGPKMPLDFFDAQGNRIKPTLIGKTAEATTWGLRTPTDRVYAIARDAEVNNFMEAVSTIDLILIDAEPGDVNKDGYVTAVDLSIVVNILAGLDNAANYNGRADVNKDGNITAADISMIVNIIAGISN